MTEGSLYQKNIHYIHSIHYIHNAHNINILINSDDMAQNNNNLQYVHMPNIKGKKAPNAPAGQAYYLPAISFAPDFTNSIAGSRRINVYKTILTFTADHAGGELYKTWRATTKAQMSARNFTPQQALPNADFREIVHGMR